MFERRNLLHVHAGPDRAAGVVEHLGGHGTENESPEQAVAMSREHDESRAGPFGFLDDPEGRVAGANQPLDVEVFQFGGEIPVELADGETGAVNRQIVIGKGLNDVQQSELRLEMSGR
jgi:hypothetical protein